MELSPFDIAFFFAFFALVVGFSMYKSRREKSSEDYFLAGRGLTWPLIGLSIVAANLSTEQFVGMAGQGSGGVGLAVSAWQLTGAVGIVIVGFTLLPRFLRAGIYTMPEYLEYRYDTAARTIMAVFMMVIYVTVTITAVLYSGGLTLSTIFGLPLTAGVWIVGGIAAIYTTWGGLKAVAWADFFQGMALLAGGLFTMVLVFRASGGAGEFFEQNADKLHMVLPREDPTLPWTGVALGMWIPIVFYCGLNQFIVQRTLAARSLREGQLGIVFAAALWLLVPFAIVIPGIAAKQLYREDLAVEADRANASVLAEFEALRATDPAEVGPLVFEMDAAWKTREPELATEIAVHNLRVSSRLAGEEGSAEVRNLVGYKDDAAYPVLIRRLITPGFRGLMFAAIAGAVISSLASMLNSASTIFTMDLYRRLLAPEASQRALVTLGRVMTLVFVTIGCFLAPALDHPRFKGVFNFIQEFQGYISPGIVAAFLVGFALKRAPTWSGALALLVSAPVYGLLHLFSGGTHFLIRMAITFVAVVAIMGVCTAIAPLREPRSIPQKEGFDARSSRLALGLGTLVILAVVAFFVVLR